MSQPTLFSALSDLGIGGLQFGGQPHSAGMNGAGHYGMTLNRLFNGGHIKKNFQIQAHS